MSAKAPNGDLATSLRGPLLKPKPSLNQSGHAANLFNHRVGALLQQ